MIIKLSMPGLPHPTDLSQFTGNDDGIFSDCQFHANDGIQEADAWFVFDNVVERDNRCLVPPNQVHYISAETSYGDKRWFQSWVLEFLRQFSHIHSCHPINLPNVTFAAPFLPWMVNANHGSIFSPHQRDVSYFQSQDAPPKNLPMSMFCSEKAFTPAHYLRLRFAEHVQKYFGQDVHWFGNGVHALEEKWDGLAPYRRSIVLENRSDYGIYSEKLLDPFLAHTEPVYWGAPDITSFFPVGDGLQLDIRDFPGSIAKIKGLLEQPVTAESKDALRRGKDLVVGELHFLERIARIAKSFASGTDIRPATEVTLVPENQYAPAPLAQKRSLSDQIYMLGKKTLHFLKN